MKVQWIDLIATGVWKLRAESFSIKLSELKKLKEAGTLQAEVVARSKEKAWVGETNELLIPIEAEVTNLATAAGKYQVSVYYTPKAPEALKARNVRALETEETPKLAVTIEVNVVDDTKKTTKGKFGKNKSSVPLDFEVFLL